MPPRKKSRVPTTTDTPDAAAPSTPGPTPSAAPTSTTHLITEPVLSDGWTDEQEITLFKAIAVYRWKPAGMHKHFRMLSITQLMRNHGVFDTHTSPPGIWAKLHTLFNLEGLDEREDLPDDETDGASPAFTDFRLPEEEFGEMMARRRLNPEGTASPSHGVGVRKRRVSESVKSGKGGGKAVAKEGSLETSEAGGVSEGDDSVARSSPVSQRSVPKKRAVGVGTASKLSVVRSAPATPRGAARTGARGGAAGSTKKTPAGSARRKAKVQESSEEEAGASGGEEEEEGSGEEGSGSEEPSGSTQEEEEEEEGGSGDEEEEEEEDEDEDEAEGEEEDDDEAEGQEEEGDDSPEVSTPRGGVAGGRRGARGGGAVGAVKTPAKRGGRKTVDSSVRRSARKK